MPAVVRGRFGGVSEWDSVAAFQHFRIYFVVCQVITPCAVGRWQYVWPKKWQQSSCDVLGWVWSWSQNQQSAPWFLVKGTHGEWTLGEWRWGSWEAVWEGGRSTGLVVKVITINFQGALAMGGCCAEDLAGIISFNPTIAYEGSYYHQVSINEITCWKKCAWGNTAKKMSEPGFEARVRFDFTLAHLTLRYAAHQKVNLPLWLGVLG